MVNPIALPDEVPGADLVEPPNSSRPPKPSLAELIVPIVAFIAFCTVVLLKATALLEPDDSAYLASIVALSHGELLLTTAQYHALGTELTRHGGQGVMQWVQLSSGQWVSEKNPGYPFYAVLFEWLHALRLAPLFAGGLASASLFVAARRWLGRWAGSYAVLLFLASGAAMSFAWRATMSTFTDASFIAVGASLLLWTSLARDREPLRRSLAGLGGFAALEIATAMRYTNVVVLGVAVVAVLLTYRTAGLRLRTVLAWLASVVASAFAIMGFNLAVYGSATKTGYADGLITFAWNAIWPNLQHMPWPLLKAMPSTGLAVVALCWMGLRFARRGRPGVNPSTARRDLVVGLALGAGWLSLWGLYLAYTWTTGQGGHMAPPGLLGGHPMGELATSAPQGFAKAGLHGGGLGAGGDIHTVRFYVPAIGMLALLGTWVLVQLPRWLAAIGLAGLTVVAVLSFGSLTGAGQLGGHSPGGQHWPRGGGGLVPPGSHAPPGGAPPGPPPRGGSPDGDHRGPLAPPPGFDRGRMGSGDHQGAEQPGSSKTP